MSFNEWQKFRLIDLLNLIGGGTPKTGVAEYWNGDIPWLSVVDFSGDSKYVYETEKAITTEGLNNSSTKILKEGQLILSARGTIGEIAMLKRDMAFNQSCYGINANENSTNNFLYYLLKMCVSELKSNANGAVFDTITKETFNHIEVSVPKIEIQIKIASILSSFDDKIENNLSTNQTLEEIARTLFKEWFVNFNYPNADGHLKQSEFGQIPESWEVGTLGDIAEQVKESVKPSSYPEKEFHHYSLPAFDTDELPSKDLGNSILSNKSSVKKYSVLFSKLNPRIPRIWSIGDIDEEVSICSTEFIGFTPKRDFFYSYLNYFLKQPELVTRLTGIATGTSNSHQRIKPSDLLELEVLIPDDEIVLKFEKIVKPILEIRFHKIIENQQLKTTRDSLLPKLMSGEIEVNV
jgi:type I restriction enzyme S subunit